MSILGGVAGSLAGGNIGRAVVSLVLDTTGYNSQLEKAKVQTTTATSGMQSATSAWSSISTAAYATAAVAAVGFAKSAVEAASEHEQVLAALTAQVGDNTGAFEDQATALQNLSGFQDEAILSADTILSRFKLTEEQVRATIPTVLDYARATGKSVPEAAEAIGRALLGNTRALKAVGISYTSTGNAAEDYANIQNLLNQKLGGQAAAYAETYAGKLEILSARFDDFKESVGGELVQQLTDIADIVNVTAAGIDKLSGSVEGLGSDGAPSLLDALNPLPTVLSAGAAAAGFLDEKLHLTDETAGELTNGLGEVLPPMSGMTDAAYEAAAASHTLSDSQKELVDAIRSSGEGIFSLETTVKDTFDVSTKEMDKGFQQMLASAVRFKRDMAILDNLKVGLSKSDTVAFEQFLVSQGPGAVDRFVSSSAAKQRQWAAEWERAAAAGEASIRNHLDITVTPRVSTSSIDLASARAARLASQLDRLS